MPIKGFSENFLFFFSETLAGTVSPSPDAAALPCAAAAAPSVGSPSNGPDRPDLDVDQDVIFLGFPVFLRVTVGSRFSYTANARRNFIGANAVRSVAARPIRDRKFSSFADE